MHLRKEINKKSAEKEEGDGETVSFDLFHESRMDAGLNVPAFLVKGLML